MCFYYTALLVNSNINTSGYIFNVFQRRHSGYEFIKLFYNIDYFLEEFKNFEKNKLLLNAEYMKKSRIL